MFERYLLQFRIRKSSMSFCCQFHNSLIFPTIKHRERIEVNVWIVLALALDVDCDEIPGMFTMYMILSFMSFTSQYVPEMNSNTSDYLHFHDVLPS